MDRRPYVIGRLEWHLDHQNSDWRREKPTKYQLKVNSVRQRHRHELASAEERGEILKSRNSGIKTAVPLCETAAATEGCLVIVVKE